MSEWKRTDPRPVTQTKGIVVLFSGHDSPCPTDPFALSAALTVSPDGSILARFGGYEVIGPEREWNSDWAWIEMPEPYQGTSTDNGVGQNASATSEANPSYKITP
jgi:hypothetical protein